MATDPQKTIWTITLWAAVALFAAGCSSASKQATHQPTLAPVAQAQPEPKLIETDLAPKVIAPQEPFEFVHKVTWRGETLSYISKWYTGKYTNWKRVAKANPRINPNRIRKGDEIVIPTHLLKRRRPMPKNYVARLTKKTKKADVQPEKQDPAPERNALPLFGPRH